AGDDGAAVALLRHCRPRDHHPIRQPSRAAVTPEVNAGGARGEVTRGGPKKKGLTCGNITAATTLACPPRTLAGRRTATMQPWHECGWSLRCHPQSVPVLAHASCHGLQ